ncbi:MAG: Ig-like domain-containing protein [Clostridiales bacterium]|nr:Ig-like domain-containing protein [Clostridiales bacterium]
MSNEDDTPSIDYTKSVKDNDLFDKGYIVFNTVELYKNEGDSKPYAKLSSGIAYASRRVNKGKASDRLLFHFATEEGVLKAYVKSSTVKPLSDEAFESFKLSFSRLPSNEKAYYNNDKSMPLQMLKLTLNETEQSDAQPQAKPTQSVKPSPSVDPTPKTSDNDEHEDDNHTGNVSGDSGETDSTVPSPETQNDKPSSAEDTFDKQEENANNETVSSQQSLGSVDESDAASQDGNKAENDKPKTEAALPENETDHDNEASASETEAGQLNGATVDETEPEQSNAPAGTGTETDHDNEIAEDENSSEQGENSVEAATESDGVSSEGISQPEQSSENLADAIESEQLNETADAETQSEQSDGHIENAAASEDNMQPAQDEAGAQSDDDDSSQDESEPESDAEPEQDESGTEPEGDSSQDESGTKPESDSSQDESEPEPETEPAQDESGTEPEGDSSENESETEPEGDSSLDASEPEADDDTTQDASEPEAGSDISVEGSEPDADGEPALNESEPEPLGDPAQDASESEQSGDADKDESEPVQNAETTEEGNDTEHSGNSAEPEPEAANEGEPAEEGSSEPEQEGKVDGDTTEPEPDNEPSQDLSKTEQQTDTEPVSAGYSQGEDDHTDEVKPVQNGENADEEPGPDSDSENEQDKTTPEQIGEPAGDEGEPEANVDASADETEPATGDEGSDSDAEPGSENGSAEEPSNQGEDAETTENETDDEQSDGSAGEPVGQDEGVNTADGEAAPDQGSDTDDTQTVSEPDNKTTEDSAEGNTEPDADSSDFEQDGANAEDEDEPDQGDGESENLTDTLQDEDEEDSSETSENEKGEADGSDEGNELPEGDSEGSSEENDKADEPAGEADEAPLPEISESQFEAEFDSFPMKTQLRMLKAFAPTTGFRFSKAYLFIGKGDELDLTELLVGTGEFSLSAQGIASLSGSVLKAEKEGYVTVKATNAQDKTAKIVIYVLKAPSSLKFTKKAYTVSVGTVITPAYSLGSDISTHLSWNSSNEEVALAPGDGSVVALTPGTAVISIQSYNGLRANLAISVLAEPEDIALSVTEATLNEGGSVNVRVSFTGEVYGSVTAEQVSGDGVVQIVKNGDFDFTVKAIASGTASVGFTVTTSSGECYSENLTLTINRAVRSIRLDNPVYTLGLGETVDVKPVALDGRGEVIEGVQLTVRSSATGRVQIKSGKLYAKARGKAAITISAPNGVNRKFTATVVYAPTSVALNPKALKITLGEQETVKYTLTKNTASQVTWQSSNTNVFTISEAVQGSAKVNAVGPGTAALTVRTNAGGKTAKINVTVVPAPTEILLDSSEYVLEENTSVTASVTGFQPSGAWAKTVVFEMADAEVASVSSTGVITGKRMGETTLTVRVNLSGGSVEKTVPVSVIPVAVSLDVPSSVTVGKGQYYTFAPVAYDRFGEPVDTAFTLVSSDTSKLSVSGYRIRGTQTGKYTVRISTKSGLTKTVSVTVANAPTKITLSAAKLQIEEGVTRKLNYTLAASGSYSPVSWASSDENVATIDQNGNVTAVASGTATITASTFVAAVKATCTVTVYPQVQSVEFNDAVITVSEGETLAPSFTVTPSESQPIVSLDYSDGLSELISIDKATGKIKGLKSGTGTLRAVSETGAVATVQVEVLPAPARIGFEYKRTKLGKGETVDIKPVVYDARGNKLSAEDWPVTLTSNSNYVTVKPNGTVYGSVIGKSTITATVSGGIKASYKINVLAAPTAITLSATKLSLTLGSTASLRAIWEGQTLMPTWTSSDNAVVEVSADGVVSAKAAGTATITARSYNGKTASCTVTVKPFPEQITFENDEYVVGEGRTIKPALVFTPSDAKGAVTYSIDDISGETIATVGEDGVVTGVLNGQATLVASVTNPINGETRTANTTINVEPAAVEIVAQLDDGHVVAGSTVYIGVGEKLTLDYTLLDGRGNDIEASAEVTSSNPKVLSCAGQTFTGKAKGTAYCVITLDNGTVYRKKVIVNDAPTGLTGLASEYSRVVGSSVVTSFNYNSGFGGLTVESSDVTVATVSYVYESGAFTLTVNTLSQGSADITISSYNGKTLSCTVNVYDEPPTVSFVLNPLMLSSGSSCLLRPVLEPNGNWGGFTFSSGNEDIVTVDRNGKLHAINEGSATVTVECAGGTGTCEVQTIGTPTVIDPNLASIAKGVGQKGYENPSPAVLKLGRGESVTLSPKTYIGEDEVYSSYTFKTSNSKIATVSAKGVVKGIAVGTATITVTTGGGMRSSFTVQVLSAPMTIKLPSAVSMQVSAQRSLNPTVGSKQFGRVTWTSSNTNIVTVEPNGVLHAVNPGSAKVTVKTYNNKTASITVNVNSAPEAISFAKDVYYVACGASQKVSTSIVTTPSGRAISATYEIVPDNEEMGVIASVNGSGVVTGLSEGTGVLIATVHDSENDTDITAQTMLVVHKPVASIGFAKSTTRIGVGETYTYVPVAYDADGEPVETAITMSSSNNKIAKFSGLSVTGVNKGKAVISVSASNGNTSFKRTFTLNVLTKPKSLTIAQGTSIILAVNEVRKLTANSSNATNVQVTWISSAPQIVSVTEDGIITALSQGTAKIYARNYNGKRGVITVNVCPEADSISFPTAETLLGVGGTRTIKAVLPADRGGIITYHSANPLIAEVDPSSGLVKAVSKGETTIVATVYNSTTGVYHKAEYTIRVAGAPVRIVKTYGVTGIAVGEKDAWQFKLYDEDGEETGSDLKFSSSKRGYIPVSGAGVITGKVVGSSVITVTAYNGVTLKVTAKCYRAPGSVGLNSTNVTISEVETYQLKPVFPRGTISKVTYSSDHPEIADVEASTGLVTAHEVGVAFITVRTFNNKTAKCKVIVLPEPDSISVNMSSLILNVGNVYSNFKGTLSDGHKGVITYVSSNETVATVDPDTGVITARAAGECQITANTTNRRTGEEYSANMSLEVIRIVLSNTRTSLGVGELIEYRAVAYDKNGEQIDCNIVPVTSNSSYVAVSGYRIKGVKAGSAKITMRAIGDAYAARTIKVVAAPTSIFLSAANNKLTADYGSLTITSTLSPSGAAGAITWTSSNTSVATVDSNGKVSGVAPGTVQITAKTYNNKSRTISLTVYNPPESIRLNKPSVTLGVGQTETLTHYFNSGAFSEVTYVSDNTGVVTVTSAGKLTAVSAGTAVITAATTNGKTATCEVTVTKAPTSVSFSVNPLTIGLGQTYDISNLVRVNEGATASYTFEIESTKLLTKSGVSNIYGKAVGSTRVRVTTHNGKTALITVKVQKNPTAFTVNKSASVLYEGEEVTFTPVMPSGVNATVVFTSSDPGVIDISEDGIATCVSVGEATITATGSNGIVVKSTQYVYSHVQEVVLESDEMELQHYDSYVLGVTVGPETAYNRTVTWTSSNLSAVSVGAGGRITALNLSDEPVTITAASVDGNIQDHILVTVTPVKLEKIELSISEIELERGRNITAQVTYTPANADDKTLHWSSSNENAVTVDQNGVITAVADSGSAVITCIPNDSSLDAESRTVSVTATKIHLVSASAQNAEPTLVHYDEMTLEPVIVPEDADVEIVWTAENPSVASVDDSGKVSGASVGTANVYADVTDTFGKTVRITYAVNVEPVHVTGIELSTDSLRMRKGRPDEIITYTIAPANADEQHVLISVNPGGVVSAQQTQDEGQFTLSAIEPGTAAVTVTTVDGGFIKTVNTQVFGPLTISATPNLPVTTRGNTIVWELGVNNAMGTLAYQISVTRGEDVVLSLNAYDPSTGISVAADANGDYQLHVVITDVDEVTAEVTSTVSVSETISFASGGNVWEYVITQVQGQLGASVRLVTLADGLTAVTIPKVMNGATVMRIDNEAFMGYSTITSVKTPSTVKEIGARAFKNCTALASMSTY